MRLYDVPRETRIRVIDSDVQVPPDAPEIEKRDIINFHHVDGMYSFCHDSDGNVVHLAAWTEVEVVR